MGRGRAGTNIGAGAVGAFGLDVSRIHWDMTSISLFGAYEVTEEAFAGLASAIAGTAVPTCARSRPVSASPSTVACPSFTGLMTVGPAK